MVSGARSLSTHTPPPFLSPPKLAAVVLQFLRMTQQVHTSGFAFTVRGCQEQPRIPDLEIPKSLTRPNQLIHPEEGCMNPENFQKMKHQVFWSANLLYIYSASYLIVNILALFLFCTNAHGKRRPSFCLCCKHGFLSFVQPKIADQTKNCKHYSISYLTKFCLNKEQ